MATRYQKTAVSDAAWVAVCRAHWNARPLSLQCPQCPETVAGGIRIGRYQIRAVSPAQSTALPDEEAFI